MKKQTKTAIGVGAGLLAAGAAAAAGYYFYASKDAKKNRKIIAVWASDLKKDVMVRARDLQKIDKAAIGRVVDAAARAYLQARTIRKEDFMSAAQELKDNWERIAGELRGTPKKATGKAPAKRRPRKATKKSETPASST